jgi:ribokinase
MPAFDVITVGSALLDIFLKSNNFITLPADQYPDKQAMALERGGKTEVQEVEVCSGGAGTNNAVSFARKGFKTAIIAELGTDLVATTIKEELKQEHVDVGMLIEEQDETTGISSILVGPDGGRSVAVYRGASGMLTEDDISWNRIDTRWMFISSLGGEMNLLAELIQYAHLNDIKVAVNPGKKELQQADKWQGSSFYANCDVLIVNREEAGLLTKAPFEDDMYWKNAGIIEGPQTVLITDGKSGGKVIHDQRVTWYEAALVKTIEETGAGDAFGSGFVAALMRGHDIPTAINWAKKQAGSVVSYMGAKRGLLSLADLTKN